ncbi:MAG: hypothetical protein SCH98_01845 [Deferrisomatales bacterium]|nr:hypothetical protein [Deferrisomatales bacterium]
MAPYHRAMGTLAIRLVAVLLLALAAPAWSAPPDPGAVSGSCCGEACPAGDESPGSGCASCCVFTLWVERCPSAPAVPEAAAPASAVCPLSPQGVYSAIERPPLHS